ncbi:MAG: MCE family protein [Caldithrix sp.]|nr:MCE family protein [Caldithrix sp.]
MISKSQKIRLGVFIFFAIVLFLAILASISFNRLFKEKDVYHIAYNNVSVGGLEVGSSVKYLGLKVGTIRDIEIDPKDINRIIVSIAVDKGTPIKEDVRADISTIGITGIKIIELSGGSNQADVLDPGGYIKPGTSLTEEITGRAEVLTNKIELILNNLLTLTNEKNRTTFNNLLNASASTMEQADKLLKNNENAVRATMTRLDSVSLVLLQASAIANQTLGSMQRVVESDTIDVTINNIARIVKKLNEADIYQLIDQLRLTTEEANQVLQQMSRTIIQNRNTLNQTLNDLSKTVRSLKSTARQVDQNPSILLRNQSPDKTPDQKLEQ